MSESLLSNEKRCVVCSATVDLHRHHIFFGDPNRKLSEEDGCWCWLCAKHHNGSNFGVHFDRELDLVLKKRCQKVWEEAHNGDRDRFRRRYGKSYL